MVEGGVVTVRGEATAPARPEEVRMIVETSALDSSPAKALDEAAARSETIKAILAELGVPDEHQTTSGLLVAEEVEWEDGRAVHRGYRARNRIALRLADPSLAGPLMKEATERAQARLEGPWWTIAPENPARQEACRRAAEQARRKAEAYAAALGLRLGPVVSASEPWTGERPLMQERMYALASGPTDERGPELELHAGDVDVSAAIDVTFRLEQA